MPKAAVEKHESRRVDQYVWGSEELRIHLVLDFPGLEQTMDGAVYTRPARPNARHHPASGRGF